MTGKDVICPFCRHTAHERLEGKAYDCEKCRRRYVVGGGPVGYPEPISSAPLPMPAKRRTLVVVVAIGGAIALGISAMAFLTLEQSSDRHAPEAYGSPRSSVPSVDYGNAAGDWVDKPSAPPSQPASEKPTAEVSEIRRKRTGSSTIWIMNYRNTGEVVISRPSVDIRLLDAAGKVVDEFRGYCGIEWLEPGESYPLFAIYSNKKEFVSAEVKVHAPSKPMWETQPLPVEVTTYKASVSGRSLVVDGVVVNRNDAAAAYVHVLAFGYDTEGLPVSVSRTTIKGLSASETKQFSIPVAESLMFGEASGWKVVAFGK